MAGVVAMASVIEDFETQPCKKSRKDGGSPVVKTITNYFSPVPKPAEKPFSPPRSNNIMSYFSRKAPSSKEKTSSPEQLKENCQTSQLGEKQTNSEAAVKHLSQKRSRKPRKAARKLIGAEPVSSPADESCMIVEEPDNNRDSATEVVSSCGVLGSDTAALLVQLCAEACITAGKSESDASETVNDEQTEKDQQQKDVSKCGSDVILQPEPNSVELSPIVPSKDKAKPVKTVAKKSKKRQPQEAKPSEPEEKETESSLNNVSMEVNVDETSRLNSSTVTVSFEDFVRQSQSQDEEEEDMEDEPSEHGGSKSTTETDKMDTDQLDIPQAEENAGFTEPSLQISPRTVTIQAEVHMVAPKQEAKVFGKVASIFNRRKGEMSSAEASSPHTDAAQQLPSALNVKRKSNVVLQEDDLELAVLESESTPKCSEAEKKQFMAAFKQPGPDASKTKSGKSQGKQKQPGEKGLDDADKVAEEETVIPPSAEHAQENKAQKKPAKKGRKKAKNEKETLTTTPAAAAAPPPPPPPPVEETVSTSVEVDDKVEEPLTTSTPSIPPLRRSRREAVTRQTPEATPTTPVGKNSDSPANASTPKTRKSKHGVFVAQILSPPDTKQSPIRIKFTRVHRNVTVTKTESGSGIDASLATKASNDSKKRKQAKKLVKKAKVLQQSKKDAAEGKRTLRQSSRAEASTKKSYCEDEDSVICLLDDNQAATPQAAPEKSKTQKMRSLNDVLGKAKAVSGSKTTSARKPSAVISIFDESSLEGSESSQGDEQFKARREFLKSGLPETFRKQIAKTAATKEAYSLSSSSFQPVTHVKQPPNDCPLWSLAWPQSALLCRLKELWGQTSDSPPSVSGSLCGKTEPARRAFSERGSGWGHQISESALQLLMEEVGTANPSFPAQKFITGFLKRRTDHQLQCAASETRVPTVTPQAEPVGGKRKRVDDEGEITAKMSKKQRANSSDERVSTAEPTKRGRKRRSKPEKEEASEEPSVRAAPVTTEDDLILVEDPEKKDVVKEDVLWTDKYQPQHSSEIIGNAASVKRLHSWLKEWKLRADREERKKQKDKKQEEGSNDSDWDCGDEDFQDGEDMLCNTVLITGPPGVGKTAAVYACAQELGFKVFEVNASSQRSGRLILSQLKEATQSHQVDSQGVNAHKPTYFNSYGTSSSAGTLRPGSSPRKVNSPRRVVSSPRKLPQSPRGAKRGGLAPTSLANFFKMGRPTKETANTKSGQTAASKKASKANEGVNVKKESAVKSPAASTLKEKNSDEQSKKTATSLILFEEVDVIFDEDSGFLAAIKTFMTTTKRPVILTTSDPAFSTMFDGNFEEIHFQTPSVLDAGSFLRLLCLAEDTRTDLLDVNSLLKLNGCDIRQSLLQLQLWTRSGGGRNVTRPCAGLKPETEEEASVPPCKTGCTQSVLGLLNIQPDRDIWELLRNGGAAEEAFCWELLVNSRRRGVDLIYSNMEALLPLPLTRLTTSTYNREPSPSVSQDHPPVHPKELPSHAGPLSTADSADCSDDCSPVKISNRMKSVKKQHRLSDQDGLHSDSDSEESFLSLCKPRGAPQEKEEVKQTSERIKRKPLTPEERVKSLPVSQCLESIADFLDNMSYTDSFLVVHPEGGDNHRRMSQVGAVVKDGMTDESRVETDRWSSVCAHRFLEIPAAVEALSFHKCRLSAAEAWDKVQKLEGKLRDEAAAELALPVAAHREPLSFAQDGLCQPQLVQRRRKIMESVMSRGVFGCLGNRSAAALDYLPALRTICRSEAVKEQGKVKRRFLHYLDGVHLGLVKSTLQHLAEDFP